MSTLSCHGKATMTGDRSLKKLPWCVIEKTTLMWTEKAIITGDRSLKRLHLCELKRLPLRVTEKATLTWTEKATMTRDRSLKIYPDVKWEGYPDINWKCYNDNVDYVFTKLQIELISIFSGYKSTSWGRELRCIQTHRPHTMGSKETEPWSP
jgi:hypothetical protein